MNKSVFPGKYGLALSAAGAALLLLAVLLLVGSVQSASTLLEDTHQRSALISRGLASEMDRPSTAGPRGNQVKGQSSCTVWNLTSEFRLSPNQANPNPDNCGNTNVWYFMGSSTLARDPTTYSLLPEFITDAFFIPGIQQWQGIYVFDPARPKNNLPAIGINATGTFQQAFTISWPPGVVRVHPHPSRLVIVAWRSPVDGFVSIAGAVTDLDANGGNGVAWFIERGTTTLAQGLIPNGGNQNFQDGVHGNNLSNARVSLGDSLYFIVDPNGSYSYDSTGLDVTINLLDSTAVPASLGSLRLIAASSYTPAQPIAPTVRVDNPTGTANAYTVIVSLLQGETTLDSLPRDVTVPGGGSATLSDFNFGTWPAGSYQLVAELGLGATRLQRLQPVNLQVVSERQLKAISEGARLKQAADAEFDEMRGIVVSRSVDALDAASDAVFDVIFRKLDLPKRLKDVGETTGTPATKIAKAGQVIGKALEKLALKNSLGKPVESVVGELVDKDLADLDEDLALVTHRSRVAQRQAEFDTFVGSKGPFAWTNYMAQIVSRWEREIRNRVEWEIIPGWNGVPPLFIGPTTLGWENAQWGFLKTVLTILGILALVAAVLLLLILAIKATLATLGAAIPAILKSAAALVSLFLAKLGALTWYKVGANIFLVCLSLVMILQVGSVGKAVRDAHDNGLDELTARIQDATGLLFKDLTTRVSVQGASVRLTTGVTNDSPEVANPLVETTLYSVDGDVIDIWLSQPTIAGRYMATVEESGWLRPGRYRAVTAIHTREGIGLAATVSTFEIAAPTVDMSVQIGKAQLTLGETVHATILVTNTNPMTSTGTLGLLAQSTDQVNVTGWEVNLATGESRRFDYRFVPQAEGSERLRVSLTDGLTTLVVRDVAYVVGNGAALAVNYDNLDVYSPGADVSFTISAINSGNQPTTTVLSLQAFDLSTAGITPSSGVSHTLALAPGESEQWPATVLPADQAVPGHYAVRVYLGDALYRNSEFSIEAQDTLFADIYPDSIFHAVGDTITLTVQVMNSVYTYTDALVDVSLWQPDGITQTVAMDPIGTGQYQGTVTAPITGTYQATVDVSKPNYRAVGNNTFFVAGERSQLLPAVDGRPILGTTQPVTVTVHNEQDAPIVGASLVVSGSLEYLSRQTDEAGQAVLQLSPTVTEPYQISLEKLGFAQTVMDLPVWIAPDTTPPVLFLDAPSITNRTPLTVTGLTEAGVSLTVNSQAIAVDAQGRFTTTLTLSEGDNLLAATATDAVSNTTTLTRTVTLDIVPPTLSVTNPTDGLFSLQQVISVTGSTEVGASLTVSGTLGVVDPASGAFNAWMLLQPGANIVPVTAADETGNTTTITRTVAYSCVFGDFDGNWWVDVADLQAVVARWRETAELLYDFDDNGITTVADIMRVAAAWGDTCP